LHIVMLSPVPSKIWPAEYQLTSFQWSRYSAEHLGPRVIQRPALQKRLRLGVELPVQCGLELLRKRGRHLHIEVPVRPARLDEQDANGGILGQSTGDHGSSRACAHNDVIVRTH